MSNTLELAFHQPDIAERLAALNPAELDGLNFGVIGFDDQDVVRLYNEFEAKSAGLTPQRVLGQPLFTVVAPCMNNFMVAQRFEDAAADGTGLDATIEYVLTLRMRPTRVALRLVAAPGGAMRYVLVNRSA